MAGFIRRAAFSPKLHLRVSFSALSRSAHACLAATLRNPETHVRRRSTSRSALNGALPGPQGLAEIHTEVKRRLKVVVLV